jgi:hypothetical protein
LVKTDQFHAHPVSAHLCNDVFQSADSRNIPEMRRREVDPDLLRRIAQIKLVSKNLCAGEENLTKHGVCSRTGSRI